jgi:hypothetical protein
MLPPLAAWYLPTECTAYWRKLRNEPSMCQELLRSRKSGIAKNEGQARWKQGTSTSRGSRYLMTTRKLKRPNALKHGIFSATAILPGEDPQEFEELHCSLIEEWMPHGATEDDAVLSIAKAVWRI